LKIIRFLISFLHIGTTISAEFFTRNISDLFPTQYRLFHKILTFIFTHVQTIWRARSRKIPYPGHEVRIKRPYDKGC